MTGGHGHVTPRPDGLVARCGGPALCPVCAQEAAAVGYHGANRPCGDAAAASCLMCGAAREPVRVTESAPTAEAVIDGERSFDDIRDLVRTALSTRVKAATGASYCWTYIADLTRDQVVYSCASDDLFQCSYTIAADGTVTLGDPVAVVRTYAPAGSVADEPAGDAGGDAGDSADAGDMGDALALGPDLAMETRAAEAVRVRVDGRVVEAKGTDAAGGRVFRVRIIAYGDSKNGRRYPAAVMQEAAPLYEGAAAYDHHRSTEELTSGSLTGLVGSYRNVEAGADGIYGDLHLLPSAARTAEALDQSLANQAEGLPPLVGVSHDVRAHFKPVVDGGRRLQEATQIAEVQSADVVVRPAAGGKAVRAVAGGEPAPSAPSETDPAGTGPDGESTRESDVTVTTADVLAALKTAKPEELAAVGLRKDEPKPTTETTTGAATAATETAGQAKDSFLGRMMVRAKVEDAGLPASVVESLTAGLPERITESDVDAQVASIKAALGMVERAGLAPTVTAKVTQESMDKKRAALDAFFDRDYAKGYRSFKEAFVDITGRRPKSFDEDFNRIIMRETIGGIEGYDSGMRASESMTSGTWNLVLGDSITRRLVADYQQPSLQSWRQVVSSTVPVNDFRTQRIDRVGGYGTLPTVSEGAPYQPLTSPTNEEATYALSKRGGTEDITLEMIANDDVRAISNIPRRLGLAAAQTLYRFVWDFFDTNPTATYDSVAWFHASHANTATNTLSQSNLSAARLAMRAQAAYGDSSDILSLVPRTLVVVNDLEELGFQLATSAVAIPSTPAGPSDTPNIHQGLNLIIVDYWSSTTKWFVAADPAMCPTLEVGFYQGREDPELFTQSDPSVGSMFNADTVTYKIRHIYSGAALDHRGVYRGNT